jgi:hypothetical protein
LRGGAEGGAGLGCGLGLGSATFRTAPMVEAASPVQTAGLGLPVVAVAVSAKRIAAAAASATGAIRRGLIPPIDFDT